LKLGRAAKAQLAELISWAKPLEGNFFRSVAFRHFHPDDVVSGEGTRLHGGRFVPPGTLAVYASLEEETALREVNARKNLLGGGGQVKLRDYPRMTYILRIATRRNLDLSIPLPPDLQNTLARSLRRGDHAASQVLAGIWIEAGIDSLVFPSATGSGRNVVVYLGNAGAGSVKVHNREAVLAMLRSDGESRYP
jgi:RES domain-containing protein